jgi:hypothetical protein
VVAVAELALLPVLVFIGAPTAAPKEQKSAKKY